MHPGATPRRPDGGRHPLPPPSRRTVLRGTAAVTLTAAATRATTSAAFAAPSAGAAAVDHPGAHWLPASPANYRAARRPHSHAVDRVVVHVTQEDFEDAAAAFRDPGRRVSAHYLVRSADGRIGQCVREKDIARHSGDPGHDERSIGIEHEGRGHDPRWFTAEMYAASAALTAGVCARYGIPPDRAHILGHAEVPGTLHTDPGANWDWDRYLTLVRAGLAARRGP